MPYYDMLFNIQQSADAESWQSLIVDMTHHTPSQVPSLSSFHCQPPSSARAYATQLLLTIMPQ